MNNADFPRPWWREVAPWLLFAGPFAVVIAGFVTVWLALSNPDPPINDGQQKQGLVVVKPESADRGARGGSTR